MKTRSIRILFLIFIAVSFQRCIDPFNPPSTTEDIQYLVVEGFLNATDSSCTIKLSRTTPISYSFGDRFETKASIQLLDDHTNIYPFIERNMGEYSLSDLPINLAYLYKLKITTQNNNEYYSDYVSIAQTPPIDSIYWRAERDGIGIYVDTHDTENKTHFYQWLFTETWSYTSAYFSQLHDVDGVIVATNENTYNCWHTAKSSSLLISASTALNQDLISRYTLTTVPWRSPRFLTRYSILVEQHAIQKDAYEYASILKNNTENLGSLFDALPSTSFGNIHCISNPSEAPIGFFTACTVKMKRIFIKSVDVNKYRPNIPVITGFEDCELDSVSLSDGLGSYIPVLPIYKGSVLTGYWASYPSCVDCRVSGGTNIKPDFWK